MVLTRGQKAGDTTPATRGSATTRCVTVEGNSVAIGRKPVTADTRPVQNYRAAIDTSAQAGSTCILAVANAYDADNASSYQFCLGTQDGASDIAAYTLSRAYEAEVVAHVLITSRPVTFGDRGRGLNLLNYHQGMSN